MREPDQWHPVLWTIIVLICGLLLGVAAYMAWSLIAGP
jgi:hypothetical protein